MWQDVLLLGDLRRQQGPAARAGRERWAGVEMAGHVAPDGLLSGSGQGMVLQQL